METTSSNSLNMDAIAKQMGISVDSVQATIELLDEGNTVPFITRYRKDRTGGLDEQQIRQVHDLCKMQRQLSERKQKVLKSIRSQEKLTPELEQSILSADSLKLLDDLYLPFKPKKQTLATLAKQKGLEPLAQEVLDANPVAADFAARCAELVNPENGLTSAKEVESGVRSILAEHFSELVRLRSLVRRYMWQGTISSKRIEASPDDHDSDSDTVDSGDEEWSSDTPSQDNAASLQDSEDLLTPAADAENPSNEYDASSSPTAIANPTTDASSITANYSSETNEPAAPALQVAADASELKDDVAMPETAATTSDQSRSDSPPEDASEITVSESDSPSTGDGSASNSNQDTVTANDTAKNDTAKPNDIAPFSENPASPPAKKKKKDKSKSDVARSKLELAKIRREQRREARRKKRKKLEQSFKDYFNFSEPIKKLPHHRLLALNRGDRSKVLRIKVEFNADQLRSEAESKFVEDSHPHATLLRDCVMDALNKSVVASIEREIRRELTDRAEEHAVKVFARNLRKLLLQPPLQKHRVLAIDPGFRSGCKLVALDEFGNVLGDNLIHVIGSADRVEASRETLAQEIRNYNITAVAIGNGTACRETEQMVANVIADRLQDRDVGYLIVSEAGASVYSTSPIGREELPKFDATVRGAVSIGRRTLDPLSELVKIDPANIGVGLYQHDVKAKHLQESLDAVVESCVNYVGVDLNSASPALLGYVSGLNQLTARRLYEHRQKNGPFRSREQIKEVPGIGEATYVQAVGFLKVTGSDNPLDTTWIHPESYSVAEKVLEAVGFDVHAIALPEAMPEPIAAKPDVATSTDTTAASSDASPAAETPAEVSSAAADTDTTQDSSSSESAVSEPAETGSSDAALSENIAPETAAEANSESDSESFDTEAHSAEVPLASHGKRLAEVSEKLSTINVHELSQQLQVGELTLQDILSSLARPGRDPREDLTPPIFRREVMKLEDLVPGMELTGTVLNVVDFGAFVDIGLSDSGLVHVSRLSDAFINDPHEVVSVGDIITTWVVEVDEKRRRVSLTAIKPGTETQRPERPKRESDGGRPRREKQQTASHDQGGKRKDKRSRGKGGKGGSWTPRPAKVKKKPVAPITDAMVDGKEPMRAFSDLQQFFDRKKQDKKDK